MAFVTDIKRPKTLSQSLPAAHLTSSGAASEVFSLLMHPWPSPPPPPAPLSGPSTSTEDCEGYYGYHGDQWKAPGMWGRRAWWGRRVWDTSGGLLPITN